MIQRRNKRNEGQKMNINDVRSYYDRYNNTQTTRT